MKVGLDKRQYSSAIKIWHSCAETFDEELAGVIIDFIWLNQKQGRFLGDFQLVQDTKAMVYRLDFKGRIYYVKSYQFRSVSKTVKNLFRPIEAVRYLKTALQLMTVGIAVAKPVFSLTYRRSMFIEDGIFVTEEVPGVDLAAYLSKHVDVNERNYIIKQIADIWAAFNYYGFLHLDPRLVNFIISEHNGKPQVVLIDIDSISLELLVPVRMLSSKNLGRLKRRSLYALSQDESDLFMAEFVQKSIEKPARGMVQKILTLQRLIKQSQLGVDTIKRLSK